MLPWMECYKKERNKNAGVQGIVKRGIISRKEELRG